MLLQQQQQQQKKKKVQNAEAADVCSLRRPFTLHLCSWSEGREEKKFFQRQRTQFLFSFFFSSNTSPAHEPCLGFRSHLQSRQSWPRCLCGRKTQNYFGYIHITRVRSAKFHINIICNQCSLPLASVGLSHFC